MSILAVVGAALQLALLLITKLFQLGDEKKQERKVLREEGIDAIRKLDVSRITAVLDAVNRL